MSWVGFTHETNANQRSKWSSWMEKCVEKKVALLGKIVLKMKIKDDIVGLMKEEKKGKQEVLERPPVVIMGEISPWLEKRKIEKIELMSIVGMELESKRVEMVKLKSQKEEFMAKLNQVKLFLDFM